jgi:hypothetical protein
MRHERRRQVGRRRIVDVHPGCAVGYQLPVSEATRMSMRGSHGC